MLGRIWVIGYGISAWLIPLPQASLIFMKFGTDVQQSASVPNIIVIFSEIKVRFQGIKLPY